MATNEELLVEFRERAASASYHHADDSCREWHLAKPHQARCNEIFEQGDDELKAEIRKIAGEYLISGRWQSATLARDGGER